MAQSFQDCVPDQNVRLFGPPPAILPQPLLPARPQARALQARAASGVTRLAPTSLLTGRAGLAAARQAAGDCPTLVRSQTWDGAAWSGDVSQAVGTYDAQGRGLVFTGRVEYGSGLTDLVREKHTYDAAGRPTVVVFEYDTDGSGVLTPVAREQSGYDAAGHLVAVVNDEWDGAAWQPLFRAAVSYGSGPYAASFLTEEAVDGVLVPSYRGAFSYTPDNRLLVSTYEVRDGSAWLFDERETWTYAGGRAAQVVRERPGASGLIRQRDVLGYAGPRLASVLTQEESGAGTWSDEYRRSFAYDGSGRLTGSLFEASDGQGTPLENNSRETYIHAPTGLAEALRESWDGARWVASNRRLDTRSAAGVLAERVYQSWDGAAWANADRELYRFDGTTAGEGGADAARAMLRAPQPNPTAGRTALAFTLDASGPTRLAVVDALGREVAVLFDGPAAAGETRVSWDTAGLPAGVYTARLAAGGRTEAQRLTVVR